MWAVVGPDTTTYDGAIDLLRELIARTHILYDKRIIGNGTVSLSVGISVGIDILSYRTRCVLCPENAREKAEQTKKDFFAEG
jgi:hypothetical protein